MAGGALSPLGRWFEGASAGAPEALRRRAESYLGAGRQGDSAEAAPVLARAAREALRQALRHPGDRTVALDLLAADALLTLALKAQAEEDPAGLADFAASLRATGVAKG